MTLHKYGLVSDTHGDVHPDLFQILTGVEMILHAGDVGGEGVLYELGIIAPVVAVAGNVDYSTPELPLEREVDLPFGKVALVHGHRFPEDKHARVRALFERFPPQDFRLIMHGHTHHQHLEFRRAAFLVNPGAAGRPRFGVMASVAVLTWNSERDLLRFEFHPLHWG